MTNEAITTRGRPLVLTEEQRAVVASRSPALRVVAFAGAGKTSTLRAYAAARPGVRMLYVAFNAAVAREARACFPAHVSCSTMHALAYRLVGRQYQHKLRPNVRAHQAARALGLNPAAVKDLTAAERALVVLRHYLSSDCNGLEAFGAQHPYAAEALAAAERLWRLMRDPADGRVPMLHDGYLKLYQLSAPQLRVDVILFDEAQDANPVVLAILRAQACRKVYVGDPHQQIYQFRHAINGMAAAELSDELCLSESFRYGEEIAAAANRLLALKGETRQVRGGRRRPAGSSQAFIARGNAAVYRQAVELARSGRQAHWVGGLQGYRLDQLLDVWRLRTRQREEIRDPFLAGFASYEALCDYCAAQDQRDLKAWMLLLDRHERFSELPAEVAAVQRLALDQPAEGVMSLCTAHKSKGLEFAEVTLAEDFPAADLLPEPAGEDVDSPYGPAKVPELWDADGFRGAVLLAEEELNLRYVAVTRAETECRSGSWSAPLFEELEDYRRSFPRCLLLDALPKAVTGRGTSEQGQQVLPPEVLPDDLEVFSQTEPVKRPDQNSGQPERRSERVLESAAVQPQQVNAKPLQRLMRAVRHLSLVPDQRGPVEVSSPECPRCPDLVDGLGLVPAAVGSDTADTEQKRGPGAVRGGSTYAWQQGALDPVRLRVVVDHYRYRYPALDWGWLLNALAELRLVAEPQEAVCRFVEQHQLGSAQGLIERFLQDAGLWVVAE
jgi:hypothetical protein